MSDETRRAAHRLLDRMRQPLPTPTWEIVRTTYVGDHPKVPPCYLVRARLADGREMECRIGVRELHVLVAARHPELKRLEDPRFPRPGEKPLPTDGEIAGWYEEEARSEARQWFAMFLNQEARKAASR